MADVLRRVLVTGASGQLGRAVVACLASRGIAVTALDRVRAVDLPVDRAVVGSASDVGSVRDAVEGVDAIVHLAALRAPNLGTAEEVFVGNISATFTVLEQGAKAGVRRAVIASSYSATGLPFATQTRYPAYLPIDEHIPLQVEDPYALSKQVDELSAAMMWWRHGLSVVALRFPFLGVEDTLRSRATRVTRDPSHAARELWTYLEERDAATACLAALTEPAAGFHTVALAAPNTLAPYPTKALLDVFYPTVPRRAAFEGRTAPVDLRKARSLLGWSAEHVLTLEERHLDERAIARREPGIDDYD